MAYRLTKQFTYEQEIRKSRFVAIAAPVDNEDQIDKFLGLNSQAKATHNCWAWRLGDRYRFHDDGEPGSTAGRPILQAIDGHTIDQIAVLVIRWFGGIKLGTGGLIRAYGGVAAECLRLADKSEIIDLSKISLFCPYPLIDIFQSKLSHLDGRIVQAEFNNQGVNWLIELPKSNLATIKPLYKDLVSGQWEIKVIK